MIDTWTFTGQPFLLWPKWVQEICVPVRMETSVVPMLRGQIVYPGEQLILEEGGQVSHEFNSENPT